MARDDLARFRAELVDSREVHELPDDWPPEALRALLEALEVDHADVADGDLWDLALMALGDLEPDDAAEVVLAQVFGGAMASGVRQNLISDLEGDRPWEEFADLSKQAGIFTAVVMLQRAFPTRFGKPDAVRVRVRIAPADADAARALRHADRALLLRILAPALGPRSVVTRLFDTALRGGPFPEADHILWRLAREDEPDGAAVFTLHAALSFLESLEEAGAWEAAVPL